MSKELQFHPIANKFPLMKGKEFDALVADIKAHGLQEDIVLYEGKILDGRNRYRAVLEAGSDISGSAHDQTEWIKDPVAYVISANIHRRHLTAKERRERIAELIQLQPEKSDRAMAEQLKVDKNVVSRVRKKAEATGAVAPVEKRTGKDGKARKKPTKKAKPDAPLPTAMDMLEAIVLEPAAGNGSDPEASAARMKAAHAAADAGDSVIGEKNLRRWILQDYACAGAVRKVLKARHFEDQVRREFALSVDRIIRRWKIIRSELESTQEPVRETEPAAG
jgi:hypothetical protein